MPRRAVGFILFRKGSSAIEYLMLKASYGAKHWTPPKGHVDPGESDITTAIRETKEESGFENGTDYEIIKDFSKTLTYEVVDHITGKKEIKNTIYFLGKMISNKAVTLSNEHTHYEWINSEEIQKSSPFDDFKKTIRECQKYISENKL